MPHFMTVPHAEWLQTWLPVALLHACQAFALLVTAGLVFDVVHWMLHRMEASRFRLFQRLGALHRTHHEFFDQRLQFNNNLNRRNLVEHVFPEFLTRLGTVLVGSLFLPLDVVVFALGLHLIQLVAVVYGRGRDSNHISFNVVPAPQSGLFVGPAYHALHHIFPDKYYASFMTFFDRIFGTGVSLKGRRIALTGGSGAFGAPLKILLEKEGAVVKTFKFGVDYTYDDYSRLDPVLRETDILVLAHGSKKDHAMEANCDSFVAITQRFRKLNPERLAPLEVWAVGSEIEFHPAWGNKDLQIYLRSKRAFAQHAYRYFYDRTFIYRHICPAGFTSRMGPGLISGARAARWAMFFIRRGFRYVPVTYTGFAFLNYFKFLARWRPFSLPASLATEEAPQLPPVTLDPQ